MTSGLVVTVGVLTLLMAGGCGLWLRRIRDAVRAGGRRRRAVALCLAVAVVLVAVPKNGWLAWPAGLAQSVLAFLVMYLLLAEPVRVAVQRWRRRSRRSDAAGPGAATDPAVVAERAGPTAHAGIGRRVFLGRTVGAAAGVLAVGTTAYGVGEALSDLRATVVPVRLARLPGRLEGFRIAAVSDIHLGSFLARDHCARVVRAINTLKPDLIAIVGDIASAPVSEMAVAARPLADLAVPAYYVTGNHEFSFGPDAWAAELAALGVRPLRNARATVSRGGAAFDLAGVEDLAAYDAGKPGPDFHRALGGRDPARPVVLLAHQPVQAYEAARHGVDLQLSGHTHGGQILPFGAVTQLGQPVLRGLATVGETQVVVTSGAGVSELPARIGVPPEVVLVELRAAT